ncbi:hypothetical protein BKA61DRAFT_571416 [Leptodontidium sp. MPI-SDFR-AT-0119]|nr:hypothetical protein BKA61DRAFT_571416 [Leptodontidium sp. MPI-SDFR-AT-0119]
MSSNSESEPFLEENEAVKAQAGMRGLELWRRGGWLEQQRHFSQSIGSHSLVFIFTSLFWAFYLLLLPISNSTSYFSGQSEGNSSIIPGANFVNCGRSVEEAEARGCEYDILSNHWIPGQCIDESAIKEYQSDGSWFGYADANHTELLDITALGRTPVYYTNERDHIIHCSFLWRKQFKAFMEGRNYLDSIVVDEEHTMHCSDFLVKMSERGPDFRTMPIKVHVGFAGCHIRSGFE